MPLNPNPRILSVRRHLDRVRDNLLQASPEAIEQTVPDLSKAADGLALLTEELSGDPPSVGPEREQLLREVHQLRADLSSLAALTAQGLEFCRRWSHVLQSAAGYLPSGEAAPMTASTTIAIQG